MHLHLRWGRGASVSARARIALARTGLRPRRLPRRGSPGHGAVAVGLLASFALITVVAAPLAHHGAPGGSRIRAVDPPAAQRPLAGFLHRSDPPLALAPAMAPPAPPPSSLAAAPPLRRHEIFGFAPWWTLDLSPGFDVQNLTTISYFGLDVAADGSLPESGDGWTGYQSQALATLISRAHGAGARVVLTVTCFDDARIHQITASPASADRLAEQLVAAIRAKNMDGANLDFEATGGADRAQYATFVSRVARTLRAADPHWQVTVDTYAGSAANPDGFFDVTSLAQSSDALFVMAYDMYGDGNNASPNAPLSGYSFNDDDAMAAYTAVVPSKKVLLGTPFYGYDWQVTAATPNAPTSSGPQPQTYADIVSSGHPLHWDARGAVPFVTYRAGDGSWHETYFDNPQSLALKAQLVNRYNLAGLGVWALGMDGNDPAMMAALLGHAAPLKLSGGGGSAPSSPSRPHASGSASASPSHSAGGSGSTPSPSHSASPSPSHSPTPRPSPTPTPAPPGPTAPPAPTPPPLPQATFIP